MKTRSSTKSRSPLRHTAIAHRHDVNASVHPVRHAPTSGENRSRAAHLPTETAQAPATPISPR